MRRIIFLLAMIVGLSATAQTKVIHQKLKLKNVPSGVVADSILVMDAQGNVKQMDRSSFAATPVVENVPAPGDPYYGPRVAPTDAASQGYFVSTDDNNAMGYMAETTSTGNAAYSGFVARGAGGPFENAIAMEFFGPNYFEPLVQNKGAIYAATDSYWLTGRNTDIIQFRVSASAAHNIQDTRSKFTIGHTGVTFHDADDDTKQITFELADITTGESREVNFQDKDGTVAYLVDIQNATNLDAVTTNGNTTLNDLLIGDEIQFYDVPEGARVWSIKSDDDLRITNNQRVTGLDSHLFSSNGAITMVNDNNFNGILDASAATGSRVYSFPDKSGTVAMMDDVLSNAGALEYLDEGNGFGWRLAARDPANHGNIGSGAIDLSTYFTTSTTHGATGFQSVAIGDGVISSATNSFGIGAIVTASGGNSMVFGTQANATAPHAMVLGHVSTASAPYAVSLGRNNTASGNNSLAIGVDATASGPNAVAIGNDAVSSGTVSMSLGYQTESYSFAETAMGMFGTTYTPNSTTAIDAADRLLNIGNGTAVGSRSDAFTILKNGQVLAPSLTKLGIAQATDDVVTTKEWERDNDGLGTRFGTASLKVAGSWTVNWEGNNVYVFNVSGATTIDQINEPTGTETREVIMYLTGSVVPTFPAEWGTQDNLGLFQTGGAVNVIKVRCLNGDTDNYYWTIN